MIPQDTFPAFTADLLRFIADCTGPASRGADASFNDLALRLFRLQFDSNPAYRNFCTALDALPGKLTRWEEVPAVPASGFKDLDLSCIPETQRTRVFHSSGSTGQRQSRHFHSDESLPVYEASLWPWFERHLLADGAKPNLLVLTPPPAQAPHSSLAHMMEEVRQRLGKVETAFCATPTTDGSWMINGDRAIAVLGETDRSNAPLMVLGPAFSFVHLFEAMKERQARVSLPQGSRVMETGGYKGRSRALTKQELHRSIRELLGAPPGAIVSEYGMSELSSQAYDLVAGRPGERVFRFPPWARARIVSPESGREVSEGDTGLIRVCDLANVFSVMHLQTEDLGIRRTEGFELIGRAAASDERGCSLMLE